mgnify:CR=1 FL=1
MNPGPRRGIEPGVCESMDYRTNRVFTALLTIASYNVCNLGSDAAPSRMQRVGRHIAEDLQGPAIVALQEIKVPSTDDCGGPVAGDRVYAELLAAISAAGGPAYEFLEIPPVADSTGGMPGFNIRTALLFDPRQVDLVSREPAGDDFEARLEDGRLVPNPALVAPDGPAFAGDEESHWQPTRRVLAAEFRVGNRPVIVLACHLKSMSATTRRAGEHAKKQRHEQALVIHAFIARLLEERPEAALVVLGDMNDTVGSKTLERLRDEELVNLQETLPKRSRYTSRYAGRPMVLDHVLVRPEMAEGARFSVAHVNTDRPYPERASDHDPVLAEIPL